MLHPNDQCSGLGTGGHQVRLHGKLNEGTLNRLGRELASRRGAIQPRPAQPKTAFLFENGKWGVPSGLIPTTRILKPPTGEFDGHAENEHYCLELARALGLTDPNSEILHFEDEIAIVVDRYDR